MTITIPVEKVKPWILGHLKRIIPFWKRVGAELRAKPLRGLIAIAIGVAMGLWLGPRAGVLWFLFCLFLVYEWENRVFGVAALLCLAACPVLLAVKQDARAEEVAVYAYFFLVMTVALQIVEFKRHPERFPEEPEQDQAKNKSD